MKKLLAVLLAVVLSVSVLGTCAFADDAVTIRVWSWDGAIQQLQEAAEVYKANNPNVDFVFEEISSGTIYDKLTTMLVSGEGLPDVVTLEGEMFAVYAEKFPARFASFDGMINEDDFLASKIAEVKIGGKLLGLPWDAAPVVMCYRTDIFEEAGVDVSNVVTWDDYIEAGKTIKEKTGKFMSSTRITSNSCMLRSVLESFNAFYFDADGNLTLDSEEMVKALQICQDMYNAGIIDNALDWSEYVSKLDNGNTATDVQAAWIMGTMMSSCPDGAGRWAVAPMPRATADSSFVATNGGSMYACTAADEAVKAAAMDYLVFCATDMEMNLNGMTKWGLYPSYIPCYSDDIFAETYDYFGGTAPYTLINAEAQLMIPLNYTQNYSMANDAAVSALADVILNGADPAETATYLQEELEPMID